MNDVTTYLRLLAVAALTIGIRRAVPLPLPLLQVAAGALLAWPLGMKVELEPEVFLLVFIAPLLFVDGWRIPKRAFREMRNVIFMMAFGLVVSTVIGLGLVIRAVVPSMPPFVAFALAAALSPTDAVAVSGITGRVKVPSRLMHVLGGEALLNDASGLVCLRVSIAAAATGVFSWGAAAKSLVFVSVGGVAIGIGVAWLIARGQRLVFRRDHDSSDARMILVLLLPYTAYLAAEHAHVSGILAAATAGMALPRLELIDATDRDGRRQTITVMRALEHVLNGIIFLYLGVRLPEIAEHASQVISWQTLGQAVLAASLALFLMRWLWVWLTLRITLFRRRKPGQAAGRISIRLVTATALAGVRGAVSLAAAVLVPAVVTADGEPYRAQQVVVSIAAGVIVVSLISASVGLPLVLRGVDIPEPDQGREERGALRAELAEAAIAAIEQARDEKGEGAVEAAEIVLEPYRARATGEVPDDRVALERVERELRIVALHAERALLHEKWKARAVDDVLYRQFMREIDANEDALASRATVFPSQHG